MNQGKLLFFLFFFSSCSFFINYSQVELEKKDIRLKNLNKDIDFSPFDTKNPSDAFFLTHESHQALKLASEISSPRGNHRPWNLLEKFYFWAIIQLHLRPDLSSPNARLQIVLRKEKKYYHYDFYPNHLFLVYDYWKKNFEKKEKTQYKNNKEELKRELEEYNKKIQYYLGESRRAEIINSGTGPNFTDIDDVEDIDDFDVDESLLKKSDIIGINGNNGILAQDFTPMSYLFGLHFLLKKHSPSTDIQELDRRIEDFFQKNSSLVSPDFHKFLQAKKELLMEMESFKKSYFNEDDPLFVHEQLPVFSYLKVRDYYQSAHKNPYTAKFYNIHPTLYPHKKNPKVQCTLEDKNIDPNAIPQINIFGILSHSSSQDFILASTTQDVSRISPFYDTPLFQSPSWSMGMEYCLSEQWMNFSLPSIAPGHFLYQAYEQNKELSSITQIPELMNFFLETPRYIKMDNPRRLILETKNVPTGKLNTLYAKNPLLYSKLEMGEIWTIYHFSNTSSLGIIMDPRTNPNIRGQHWTK